VLTIGGELTFVKLGAQYGFEANCFHSAIKEQLSLRLAVDLAAQTKGEVLARRDSATVPMRHVPYAEVRFVGPSLSNTHELSVHRFFVRPDSGVIEVNLPPSASIAWSEKVIQMVYECASRIGLAPTRRIGQRSIGSRGGFHITFSDSGSDSHARLNTLALALGFIDVSIRWPFLSYLFCGDRSGTDGFHPRLDEIAVDARDRIDVLNAIVSDYKERLSEEPDPWPEVATAMTQLMRDRFGHSHVVEISLDKLWSINPDRNFQIVEMRQFEMTDSVELALALVRFLWAIADRIAHQNISLNDGSRERFNPDIMDDDLARFCLANRLSELNVDARALSQISRSRYPVLFEADHPNFHIRLRLGRVESFCELYRARDDVHIDIFVPYRIAFSLMLSHPMEHSSHHLMTLKVSFVDSYPRIRQAAIDASDVHDLNFIYGITSTVVQHVKSRILTLEIGGVSAPLDISYEGLRKLLHETKVIFSLRNKIFSGILYVDRDENILGA